MQKFVPLALLVILPLGLSAERLTLRDGTSYNGRFISGNSQEITFQDDTGVRRQFNLNQIQNLSFDTLSTPANDRFSMRGADRRDNTGLVTLPAGTQISVRTDQEIQSENAQPGATYPARITEDITDTNGAVAIPRGAQASLVIRDMREGDTLKGGNFVLDLDSLQINNRRYMVSTTDMERGNSQGIGANRRTAEMVGGGAALGTLLGAIAGGGKGAAIGAIAGAAAGGGVQVLTKGDKIRVPAETVLNFRLDQPLTLREAR
jgi:hypothetical protein